MIRTAMLGAAALAAAPAAAAPETYVLDPAHTQVVFEVERFGFTQVIGWFGDIEGELVLDEANPASSSVAAALEAGSVDLGHPTRNEHVAGQFWLNAAEHPRIAFRSTGVTLTGEDSAEIAGELTLLGVTWPVAFSARLNRLGEDPATQRKAAGFSASGVLMRSDFGNSTAAALVGDEVGFRIETLAHLKVE